MAITLSAAPRRAAGFTLLELLMVVTLIGISSGLVALALRSSTQNQLEKEAVRLITLLEVGRAQSRIQGFEARWKPIPASENSAARFEFLGLSKGTAPMSPHGEWPTQWLHSGMKAFVWGAAELSLGPEPFIGPQTLILELNEQKLTLVTDGFSSFHVLNEESF